MKSATETPEDRIRERAYHLWEASGRPSGREVEFWHRAREMIATDDGQPKSTAQRHKPTQTKLSQPSRTRGRQTSRSTPLAHRSRPTDSERVAGAKIPAMRSHQCEMAGCVNIAGLDASASGGGPAVSRGWFGPRFRSRTVPDREPGGRSPRMCQLQHGYFSKLCSSTRSSRRGGAVVCQTHYAAMTFCVVSLCPAWRPPSRWTHSANKGAALTRRSRRTAALGGREPFDSMLVNGPRGWIPDLCWEPLGR
jgi:hypothetical protein